MQCGYCTYRAGTEADLLAHRTANHDTSRPPVVRVRFAFARGQRVHIAGQSGTVYTVRRRCYIEREGKPAYTEYEVAVEGEDSMFGRWVVEADLLPVKE
jgi:hypothetical protein